MTPRHHLRAALLARRLRALGLTVTRIGCSLRITGGRDDVSGALVDPDDVPLVAVLSAPVRDKYRFAYSPAGIVALIAAELLPSPTA